MPETAVAALLEHIAPVPEGAEGMSFETIVAGGRTFGPAPRPRNLPAVTP